MTSGLWNYLLALRDQLLNRPLPYLSNTNTTGGSGRGRGSGKTHNNNATGGAAAGGRVSGASVSGSGVGVEAADDEEEEEEEEPWIDECSSEPHTTTPILTSTSHTYTSTIHSNNNSRHVHNTDAATGAVIPPTQTTEHWYDYIYDYTIRIVLYAQWYITKCTQIHICVCMQIYRMLHVCYIFVVYVFTYFYVLYIYYT